MMAVSFIVVASLLPLVYILWYSLGGIRQYIWSTRIRTTSRYNVRTQDRSSSFLVKKWIGLGTPREQQWTNNFPPSRRPAFLEYVETLSSEKKARVRSCAPSTDHREDVSSSNRNSGNISPTGISVGEIAALGVFPDYARLSGVPLPKAYPEFDITKALPRPYRPFRWPYHQTMSLSKLEPDFWLELESSYIDRIGHRKSLFAEHGKLILDYLPGSELACKELMEMCLVFLCARYPHYFSLSPDQSTFYNGILRTSTRLTKGDLHPLHVLLENIPEDFALMIRNPDDGLYYFQAGVICSALGWHLGMKIGRPLHEVHGNVPEYHHKMRFSMDRYFSKLPTEKPIQRGSWTLEFDQPLFLLPSSSRYQIRQQSTSTTLFPSSSSSGSCTRSHTPTTYNTPGKCPLFGQTPTANQCPHHSTPPPLPLENVNLRIDWQTLRRLPLTGSIAFNIKTFFTPLPHLQHEPMIPRLLKKLLEEGKEGLMRYKSTGHVEGLVLGKLGEWDQEQIRQGMVPGMEEEEGEVGTLEEAPFYKGWEERWKGQQGF